MLAATRRQPVLQNPSGAAYVETLVALTLLAVVLVPLWGSLVSGLRTAGRAEERFAAVNVLRSEAESLKAEVVRRGDLTFLPEGGTTKTVTAEGEEFTVERSVTKPGEFRGRVARVDLTVRSADGHLAGSTTLYLYERGR